MIDIQRVQCRLRKFVQDESGAAAIEYGLIAAGVVLALIPFLPNLKNFYISMLKDFAGTIKNMMP